MAQPGGLDADQEFGVTRRVELEVGDRQRSGVGIAARSTDLIEDCAADSHGHQLALPDPRFRRNPFLSLRARVDDRDDGFGEGAT